ncbi:TolC family protein [Planctomycetota bacterium]
MRNDKIYLLICLVWICGCTSKEQFYEEVGLSRQQAYRQWESRKQAKKQSQVSINGKLSVEDCLKLTLSNNKMLERIAEEKQVARGEEMKSLSAILPSAAIASDYTRLDKVGSLGTITFGSVDTYSAELVVSQPVFAGGSIEAELDRGKLLVLFADEAVRGAVEDVIYEAQRTYYDVLLNQHLYQISVEAVRSSQAHLDDVKAKRSAGMASDFDVLRAQVELSNFKADLIRNQNAIKISKAELLKVMGVSQDSDVVLSDELTYSSFEISMEEAVKIAFTNRPDLFQRQFDIKIQEQLVKIARSKFWPSVSGFYSNHWSRPDPHASTDIGWGQAWSAGARANFTLFDGFSREGEVIVQKAKLKQSQIDLIDTEETVLFELTRALFSIEDADEFVQSQKLNLERAQEASRLADVGYKEGINTQVEVIDAESASTEARSLYYQAIYSHIISKLNLHKAMGVLVNYK